MPAQLKKTSKSSYAMSIRFFTKDFKFTNKCSWQVNFICPGGNGLKKKQKKEKKTNNKFPLREAFARTTTINEMSNRNELKLH